MSYVWVLTRPPGTQVNLHKDSMTGLDPSGLTKLWEDRNEQVQCLQYLAVLYA